jgi:Flp pilus assembly pilin Flp
MDSDLLYSLYFDEQGQDLIEYTLLLAFVCIIAASVFTNAGRAASGIWTIANLHLRNASSAAS